MRFVSRDGAAARERGTRDEQFRIHDGRTLSSTLLWADGTYAPNTTVLRGVYPLVWRPYTELGGLEGHFRCLAVLVGPTARET